MPNPSTHIYFAKKIVSKNSILKNKINYDYLISGAIYPDFYYFVPFKTKKFIGKNLSDFWHGDNDNNKIGFKFAKDLVKYSKTKEEFSFALGFLSHFCLDLRIHGYFRKTHNLSNINHLILEHFLDMEHKIYVPMIKCPKRLLKEVFRKEHPLLSKKYILQLNLNHIKRFSFKITYNTLKFLILKKYKNQKRAKKIMIWDLFLYLGYKKPLTQRYFKNIKRIIYPDFSLKDKHMKNMKQEMKNAEEDFIKEIESKDFKIVK
ncbi:MAG: zinc dependent phospholipase C family protein [archaeon]|jgi:hypothetical protein|nr:zinc dependent phospholipase C family protein [archaeon]MDD2477745.1 zinc dependent phospholipase C family protein [Candidatus ainarchaeum sp.]MDD3084632.1 zinc dependent phospholipase C family protein [Candidatus ainarchaeum sp.]MDD4221322.1 zinc dependent phospholipase C family protein [Candidatus ainarchaeum sp.]MDD4662831.1 zinc dependent phospholipase C family protein [Candidatus ainarchaeum sp.]